MFSVTRVIHFCYGHRLLNYAGKCRFLHGHNGRLEVTLSKGALNRIGMVLDFEEIKHRLQAWLEAELDHRMILSRRDPMVPVLRRWRQPLVLLDTNPTAEAIARRIHSQARKLGLPVSRVRLWETPNSSAEYGT